MSNILNKQNIVIVIGEYTDKKTGHVKKQYRTIGELITMKGQDGSYQFGKIWGPGGATDFKIYEQTDRNNAVQAVNEPSNIDDMSQDIPF